MQEQTERPTRQSGGIRQTRIQAIMDAAEAEFAQSGFQGTSVQAIADRAHIQKRLILYYFSTKEDLYKEVIERIFLEWRNLDPVNWQGSPRQVIASYVDHIFQAAEGKPHRSKLIVAEMMSGGQFGIEIMRLRGSHRILARTVAFLEGCMDRGQMRRTDAVAFLFQIWSAQHFYVAFEPEVGFFLGKPRLTAADWQRFRTATKEFALSYFTPPEEDEAP